MKNRSKWIVGSATILNIVLVVFGAWPVIDGYLNGKDNQGPSTSTLIAIAAVIVGGMQAWVYRQQRDLMHGQLALAERQTAIQIETQRPHVFLVRVETEVRETGYVFNPIWKNTGLTPPLNFRGGCTFRIFDNPPDGDFYYAVPTDAFDGPSLGVGLEIPAIGIRVSAGELQVALSAKKFAFFWGGCTYTDGFTPEITHHVEWCMRIENDKGIPRARHHLWHNRTYDEVKSQ